MQTRDLASAESQRAAGVAIAVLGAIAACGAGIGVATSDSSPALNGVLIGGGISTLVGAIVAIKGAGNVHRILEAKTVPLALNQRDQAARIRDLEEKVAKLSATSITARR